MASTEREAEREAEARDAGVAARCPCTDLAAVTERSALAAGRLLGRGDPDMADRAASVAMREALDAVPVSGTLVIGRDNEAHALHEGSELGAGGRRLDLACDPVGNGTAVAGGRPGALSILAASDPGGLMQVPRMYMRKMAVGPVAKGRIDLRQPVRENLEAIADAFGRRVADVTAIVLDRTGIDDLVRGDQTVVATGISGGDLLRGVRYMADGARTQSLVLCSRCNRVRFIDSIHLFSGDRHEEIRL